MATLTDPARELGDIAQRLASGADAKGAKFLADAFGVEVWSTSFFKIISCILERADLVADIVRRSDMDEDQIEQAIEELDWFKSAFAGSSLFNSWNNAGQGGTLMQRHGRPIQFMSPSVRKVVSYPHLSANEVEELLILIDRYLDEVAIVEDDHAFVRQAIFDGLSRFRFQLKHMGWMGSGYVLATFREVLWVYEVAQQDHANSVNPDAEAALRELGVIVSKVKDHIKTAKGWADAGQFVWKAYQLGSAAISPLLIAHQANGG